MSKKKRKQQSERSGSADTPAGQWTFGHLMIALIIGLAIGLGLGGTFGYNLARDPPPAGAGTAEEPQRNVRTDRYGRPEGDFHFGHDHP